VEYASWIRLEYNFLGLSGERSKARRCRERRSAEPVVLRHGQTACLQPDFQS
jgi:hypothetical protein